MAYGFERLKITGEYRRLIAKQVLGFKDVDSVTKAQVKILDKTIAELAGRCDEERHKSKKNGSIFHAPYKTSRYNARA